MIKQNIFLFSLGLTPQQKANLWGAFKVALKAWGTYYKDFEIVIREPVREKSWKQLKAFYECINQLLPQYNARQVEQGEKEFFEDEFKFILKYVGGYYKTIKNKKGEMVPIEKSFAIITKEDMIKVLSNIQKWAINEGFTLCIDEELREVIKYYEVGTTKD